MNRNEKIGIFDSGLGAISVLKEVKKNLPNENFIYYGDSANAPYGASKTDQDIQKLCENVINFFRRNNCKIAIIASNTGTIAALDYLQKKFDDIKIVGIIDSAIETVVANTIDKKVAVISTKFTADSHAYRDLIQVKDKEIEVKEIGCLEFASMIEQGWETFDNADELLNKYMSMIPVDYTSLVLGCTHYPLILDHIKKLYKGQIIDPAREFALSLKKTMEKENLLNESKKEGRVVFFVTGDLEKFISTAQKFLGDELDVYKI